MHRIHNLRYYTIHTPLKFVHTVYDWAERRFDFEGKKGCPDDEEFKEQREKEVRTGSAATHMHICDEHAVHLTINVKSGPAPSENPSDTKFIDKHDHGHFAFSPGIQFRLTALTPTPPNTSELSIVDGKSPANDALISYHQLLSLPLPFLYYGCENSQSSSDHMTTLLNQMAPVEKNLVNFGTLQLTVGKRCPGLEQHRKDVLVNFDGELAAYRNLYHRCALQLLPRLEKTYTMEYLGTDVAAPVKRMEYNKPSDHDQLMEVVLGWGHGFMGEVSTTHEYPPPSVCTRKFSVYVNNHLVNPRLFSIKSRETSTELMAQKHLLALQTVRLLRKNAAMFLQKTYVANWESYRLDHQNKTVYEEANAVIWLLFRDSANRESVVVIHGIHKPDSDVDFDFPLIPVNEKKLEILHRKRPADDSAASDPVVDTKDVETRFQRLQMATLEDEINREWESVSSGEKVEPPSENSSKETSTETPPTGIFSRFFSGLTGKYIYINF